MASKSQGATGEQHWVEVADEPDHRELFRNKMIRVYEAVIRPGCETLYHRHDKDTLYVVLEGGKNDSAALPGSRAGKYVFPRSIGLSRKIRWILTFSLFGWTYLPKSIYFFMHSQGSPIIHKVRGSKDNPSAMRMLGIEFHKPGGCGLEPSAGVESLPVDYEDRTVRVSRLKIPSDLRRWEGPLAFTGLVIALKGSVRTESYCAGNCKREIQELKEGDFLWNEGASRLRLLGSQGEEGEALIVRLK